jgi:hypothetical protein
LNATIWGIKQGKQLGWEKFSGGRSVGKSVYLSKERESSEPTKLGKASEIKLSRCGFKHGRELVFAEPVNYGRACAKSKNEL